MLIIFITMFAMAPKYRSGDFVFGHYDASASGWAPGWAFFVGLLQAAYVLTGYGLVASMCEEVQNPAREVPKAMVLSVAAAGLTGIFYILPLLFTLPSIERLLNVASGQPIGTFFKIVTGSASGEQALRSSVGHLLTANQAASAYSSSSSASGCSPG